MRQFTFKARTNFEVLEYFRSLDCEKLVIDDIDFLGDDGLTVIFTADVDDISQLQTRKTRVLETA